MAYSIYRALTINDKDRKKKLHNLTNEAQYEKATE